MPDLYPLNLQASNNDFSPSSRISGRIYGATKWDACGPHEQDVIPLSVAEMDFPAPQAVVSAIKARAENGIFGYASYPESATDAFVEWMKRRRKLNISPLWVCHSPGVVPALHTAVQSLTSIGDPVVIQTPVYHPFHDAITKNNRRLVDNPLKIIDGRYYMDLEDLNYKLKSTGAKLMILCSPHNPVGRVWDQEELIALIKVLKDNNVVLVSDEIHGDLILPGAIMTSSIDPVLGYQEQCISCSAPSKTFNIAGLQSSFIVIPNQILRERFRATTQTPFSHGPNSFGPIAAEAGYRFGDKWLDDCLLYLGGNRDYFKMYFREEFPQFQVFAPEGSYLAWLDCCPLGLEGDKLVEFWKTEAKVWVSGGGDFASYTSGFVRINLAAHRNLLEDAFSRMKKAYNGIKKK